jgi:Ca2+-binding EF-hand superfamily protein
MLPLFTQFLDDSELRAIRETFLYIDEDDSGFIEIDELRDAFKNMDQI